MLGGLTQRRLLVAVVFLGVLSLPLARPTDIDFWWHLETGELIANSGAVPTTDPFSFTAAGREWTAHEWLWDLAIYSVYQLGGYRLAVALSAIVVALTYLVLYRLLRRLGSNEIVSALLVVWAVALALPSIGVRPRELTHLFLAWYVSRLMLYRAGQVRRLWCLPLVMLVWVNAHGPFVLGLGVLAIFTLEALGEWLFSRREFPRHLLLVGGATLAATAVNPRGPEMLLYPLGYYLQGENPSFQTVTEFQSPDFHDPLYLAFAASLVLLMLLGNGSGRLRLGDALLLVIFTLQTLVSVRHVTVFGIVVAPLIAERLIARFSLARELKPVGPSRRLVALNWALLGALVLAGVSYAGKPPISDNLQIGVEPSTRSLPVAGVDFVEERGLPDPVFNHQPWGGYLIHRWYPERKVFVDGRVDMYGPAIVDDYMQVAKVQPDWREVLDRHGVQTILIEKGSALSTLLLADGGWERVFQGEIEDVFVRKGRR